MPDQNQDSPSPAKSAGSQPVGVGSHLIENVPVRLEAYLGGAQLTVGELAALREGSVVPLDAPLSQAVELRLNGVVIARGELVSAGEKFAVRLIELSK